MSRTIIIIRRVFFTLLAVPVFTAIISVGYSYLSFPRQYNQPKDELQFWIGETGPTGPIFSGPQQDVFICTTIRYGLGQPIIDDNKQVASAVFPEIFGIPLTMLPPIGYSKYCSISTRVDYFYFHKQQKKFLPLRHAASSAVDVQMIQSDKGEIPFIVRVERGTLNRFIYSIAMLAPYPESLQSQHTLNNDAWNGKLVYMFQGGVGIGHYQGSISLNGRHALHYESLKRGYAVAYSTGTRTSTHYNLKLAEETAYMLKQHFEAIYGKPEYTVGLGGSGGAIQQYVIAQNHPGIIDAAIPQASFPDMITQTINVADCELLERYFDNEYIHDHASQWADWSMRSLIEGTVANSTAIVNKWKRSPSPKPGSSECVAGWRGIIPAVFNPYWTHPEYYKALKLLRFPKDVIDNIKWSHWNDLGNIYPRDKQGFAPNSWDNVGVQYGLKALRQGKLDKQSFIDLNACIGGWKRPQDMTIGNFPWNRLAATDSFDPWDQVNMNLSKNCKTNQPAPRTHGNLKAIQIAYESGHVFTGEIHIPIIDIRWYLEPVLNMHHSIASFSARARIQKKNGNHDNHIIWISECSKLDTVNLDWSCSYEPTGDALEVVDQWMENIRNSKQHSISSTKPARAIDTCFAGDGRVIFAGKDAWDGILNQNRAGTCTKHFPMYSTSRIQAGDNINGSTFKCALKPVDQALHDGTYGQIHFNKAEIQHLNKIFPDGVCDYTKVDMTYW